MTMVDDPSEFNPYYPPGRVHREIGDILEALAVGDVAQDLMSRDHYKTSFIQRGFSLYNILEATPLAHKGLLLVSYAPELSEETFDRIIQILSTNKRILSFYGYVIDDTKQQKRGKKKKFKSGVASWVYQTPSAPAGLRCTSFQAGDITGQHPGIVFLDDIQVEELSDTKMRRYKRIILKTLIPTVTKTGIIIITGTIKGWNKRSDIYLLLESNPSYLTFKYPAVTDEHGLPKFPPMSDVDYEIVEEPWISKLTGKPIIDFRTGQPKTRRSYKVNSIANEDEYIVTFPNKFTLKDLVIIRLKYRFGDIEGEEDTTTDGEFFSEFQLQPNDPHGKYFSFDRVSFVPPKIPHLPAFHTFEDLRDYCKQANWPIYCWLDPGGRDAHGVAIVIGTQILGHYVIFDMKVIRSGVPTVAKYLAELYVYWLVDEWYVEGNFNQDELYGQPIDDGLHSEMEKHGWLKHYKAPLYRDNSTNKLKRIDARWSMMLGYDNDPLRFHINKLSDDYEQWYDEFRSFGDTNVDTTKVEWDLLDGGASLHIHAFASAPPTAVTGG